MGQESSELVDVPTEAFDGRYELVVGSSVWHAKEEFQGLLDVSTVFVETIGVFDQFLQNNA